MRVSPSRRRFAEVLLIAGLFAVAVLARLVSRDEMTPDMKTFFYWYAVIERDGGRQALSDGIGNYYTPFVYLFIVLTHLPGAVLVKIKLAFALFDLLLAFFVHRIVALRWTDRRVPLVAALIVILLPTVVINASFYGQNDAMWASFAAGGLFFALRDQAWPAAAMCGVAFAIKPQGIFILPLVGLLFLAGRMPWHSLLAVPGVYALLGLPAVLLGRSPVELATLYFSDDQPAYLKALNLNAPNVFALYPVTTHLDAVKALGTLFTVALILGVCYIVVAGRAPLTPDRIVLAAAFLATLTPFFLPHMHERYFFLADVLTVALAFYRPRLWFVPLLVQAGSLLAYQPFLFGRTGQTLPLSLAAALVLAALVTMGHALLRESVRAVPAPPPKEPGTSLPTTEVEHTMVG